MIDQDARYLREVERSALLENPDVRSAKGHLSLLSGLCRWAIPVLACLALHACAMPADVSPADNRAQLELTSGTPVDDGTFLDRIDPLGGQWRVARFGESDVARFGEWVNFSAGGFLNHGAGCAGGHPAFYRIEGGRIAVTRLEPVRIGKCAGTAELAKGTVAVRGTAAQSERRLASFIDGLSSWSRAGGSLMLTARDGRTATLTKPVEPYPNLAGRWLIETIGGKQLVTERRQATLSISLNGIGAFADCNSMGGQFTVPAPGRISVTGPLISTEMGCAPEDAAEDALMTSAMTQASAYRLEGERLVITGGPGMALRRPAPFDRRLEGKFEACGNTLLGAYHEGSITLAITGKTMRDNADCTATFTANGPELSLQLGAGPACSGAAPAYVPGQPVGVGGNISMLSMTRPDAFAFNDEGQLILRTSLGLLTMCRKGSPPPFGS